MTIYDKAKREQIGAGRTYTNANSNPKTFEMPTGEFVVVVKPVKLAGKSAREINVVVRKGETVEQKVEF